MACTQAHECVFLSTVSRSLIDIGLERKILLKVDLRKHSVIVWPGSICRQACYVAGSLRHCNEFWILYKADDLKTIRSFVGYLSKFDLNIIDLIYCIVA